MKLDGHENRSITLHLTACRPWRRQNTVIGLNRAAKVERWSKSRRFDSWREWRFSTQLAGIGANRSHLTLQSCQLLTATQNQKLSSQSYGSKPRMWRSRILGACGVGRCWMVFVSLSGLVFRIFTDASLHHRQPVHLLEWQLSMAGFTLKV